MISSTKSLQFHLKLINLHLEKFSKTDSDSPSQPEENAYNFFKSNPVIEKNLFFNITEGQ